MESWLDILDNPERIRSVYGNVTPSLNGVSVEEICFHRGSTRLDLRFDLMQFPDIPPVKWKRQNANTVQIELMVFPIRSVALTRWVGSGLADLSIVSEDEGIVLEASGETLHLSVNARFVRISEISAYLNEERVDESTGAVRN